MIRTSKDQNVINQNVKNQNVENQNVKNQNVKNQNVENQNVESLKMTFDVLIFLDAIGNMTNIRTSKVLVHFLAKKLSTFLFYLWRQKRSERRKLKRATTYGILPMCTKACGGLGKGQFG